MERGRLRVYLGAAPGVGKTHAMLDEGVRRRDRGTDVVIGVVDTTGRPLLGSLAERLEQVSPLIGADGCAELDTQAVRLRRPDVVLVDDLAHRIDDSHSRWQAVEELLADGINVLTTVNIANLESLGDIVAGITGVTPDETVPDVVVRSAAQIELVDMSPEALRRRLAHGHVFPAERVDAALANLFRPQVLGALRQLSLLWVADRVEEQLERELSPSEGDDTRDVRERVVVALGGEGGDHLVRRAARLAGRTGAQLIGVHVVSPDRQPGPDLERQRRLLTGLGGTYREVVGNDVADAIGTFARVEQATQIVLGARAKGSSSRRVASVVGDLVGQIGGADIHVVATDVSSPRRLFPTRPARSARPPRQTLLAWLLCLLAPPLLTIVLVSVRSHVAVGSALLLDLCVVMGTAALGGLRPGLVASLNALALTNW
ncbi:MAG: universal stress protein, partial [Ilumatobacteraceae bacterium]